MTRSKTEYMWPFFIVSSVELSYVNEFTWRLNEGNVKQCCFFISVSLWKSY
jgi:hypothetical protein